MKSPAVTKGKTIVEATAKVGGSLISPEAAVAPPDHVPTPPNQAFVRKGVERPGPGDPIRVRTADGRVVEARFSPPPAPPKPEVPKPPSGVKEYVGHRSLKQKDAERARAGSPPTPAAAVGKPDRGRETPNRQDGGRDAGTRREHGPAPDSGGGRREGGDRRGASQERGQEPRRRFGDGHERRDGQERRSGQDRRSGQERRQEPGRRFADDTSAKPKGPSK